MGNIANNLIYELGATKKKTYRGFFYRKNNYASLNALRPSVAVAVRIKCQSFRTKHYLIEKLCDPLKNSIKK